MGNTRLWGWLVLGAALLAASVPACSCNSSDAESVGGSGPSTGGATVIGGELVLRVLLREEVLADPDKWRAILTMGTHEALGNLDIGCVLGSLQIVLWSIARRRPRSARPGHTARPAGSRSRWRARTCR
jgi:hypothetical protein